MFSFLRSTCSTRATVSFLAPIRGRPDERTNAQPRARPGLCGETKNMRGNKKIARGNKDTDERTNERPWVASFCVTVFIFAPCLLKPHPPPQEEIEIIFYTKCGRTSVCFITRTRPFIALLPGAPSCPGAGAWFPRGHTRTV